MDILIGKFSGWFVSCWFKYTIVGRLALNVQRFAGDGAELAEVHQR
jgi:hypothetical protein